LNLDVKFCGIIRKIDQLGRLVIPMEIRKDLKIKNEDPLEILYDRENGVVVLRKYEPEK
jgi:AbrB family looped-hinge helix DNA binding protein